MKHLRSTEAREQRKEAWNQKQKAWQLANRIKFDYSFHDYLNGEIAHTVPTEQIIFDKIKVLFGDGSPQLMVCANTEYGEILNPKHGLFMNILTCGRWKISE